MGWSRWLGCVAMLAAANGPAQTDPLAPLPPAAQPAPPPLYSSAELPGFEGYKQRLIERARREGVSESTIMAVIPPLTLNNRVIDLDRGQPGQVNNPNAAPPFAPYRRAHVTQDLIDRGRAVYSDV